MVLIIIIVLLLVAIIFLVLENNRISSEYVHVSKISPVRGQFASHPSITINTIEIVNSCSALGGGVLGDKPCIFSNVNSLQEATDICNQYITHCVHFVYDSSMKTMGIVESSVTWQPQHLSKIDGYSRQL
jgi:hypothetical protein